MFTEFSGASSPATAWTILLISQCLYGHRCPLWKLGIRIVSQNPGDFHSRQDWKRAPWLMPCFCASLDVLLVPEPHHVCTTLCVWWYQDKLFWWCQPRKNSWQMWERWYQAPAHLDQLSVPALHFASRPTLRVGGDYIFLFSPKAGLWVPGS